MGRGQSRGTGAARIAQLHPMGNRANFRRMLDRAHRVGFDALCLTLDCATAGWRERNMRNGFDVDVVVLGRAAAMALAADGGQGVARLLTLLKEETATTVKLLGVRGVREIDGSSVRPAAADIGGGR